MDAIEKRILEIIDERADEIIAFGEDIWYHAEVGFQEFRTAEKFADKMREFGMEPRTGLAITGVKSYLKPHEEGEVNVCLMGELDALPMPNHPDAWSETGAAHACGHNAQITGVMGAAMALSDPEVRKALGGNVTFFGVPCEEASAAGEVREKLLETGKLHFGSGKQELIYLREMDDLSIVVGHHIMPGQFASGNSTSSGFIQKDVRYIGKAGHTASEDARAFADAQSAASIAFHNIDAQREFLKEGQWMRIHGRMTNVPSASNIFADDIRMEFTNRGKTLEDMKDCAYRVHRALKAAAIATGCGAEIITTPGYLPVIPLDDDTIADEVFGLIDPSIPVKHWPPEENGGTCDFGDVSCIMPVYQLYTNGSEGDGHSIDYRVADKQMYYINTAKMFALMAYKLLKDNAAKAKDVIEKNKPLLTVEEYLKFQESCKEVEVIERTPVPDFSEYNLVKAK